VLPIQGYGDFGTIGVVVKRTVHFMEWAEIWPHHEMACNIDMKRQFVKIHYVAGNELF
jgi:hypothetical protein